MELPSQDYNFFVSIHCFNRNATNDVTAINCLDMEISYYLECYSYKAEYVPKCLKTDVVSAEFSFDMPFEENYFDISSENTQQLWRDIGPLLKRSFGKIEISTKLKRITKGSVIILIDIQPTRHSAADINSLLNNSMQ